jgi:hypothetical protein
VDLTRAIGYRGFALNTLIADSQNRNYGCELTRVEWRGAEGVGYTEKRALADGRDASDVYLDRLVLALQGAVYGINRAHLWDLWQELKTALTPTAAFDEEPGDKGFMPLDFWVPTRNITAFPSGFIHQQILARPVGQPTTTFLSDAHGGADEDAMSLRWEGVVECRDPRTYAFEPTIIDMAGVGDHSGSLINLGDYPTPLNILLILPPLASDSSLSFIGAGTDMTITLKLSSFEQTYRYSASEKVLSLEKQGSEVLRMDLLSFFSNKTHPLVQRGSTPYILNVTGAATFLAGSRIWHWDSWA